MNKTELIEHVALQADISKAAAARAVEAVMGGITASLKKGEAVTLVGFGTFDVSDRKARVGRNPEPTAAIIDAQSTRSTAQGGMTGFDAGKKVKGRKRNLVVDTLGLLLAVTVTSI